VKIPNLVTTSSQVDFHARTYPPQAKEKDLARKKTQRGRVSGSSSPELFEKFDPVFSWLKTYLLCEAEALTKCSMTWKHSITPHGRSWLVLTRLEPRRFDDGCGYWATPEACQSMGGHRTRGGSRSNELLLAGQVLEADGQPNGKGHGSLNARWSMQLMGFPDEYADELTKLCREWSATHGATKTPS